MRNKTISLSEDIFEKLTGEDNASNLIDTLLRKHYIDFGKTDEQIIADVKQKISDREKAIEQAKEKLNNPNFIEITGRSMTEEEYKEFWKGFQNGDWNIVSYAEKLKSIEQTRDRITT